MELAKQNVLFFSRSTQHGGAENVVLQLCKILNGKVNKIVVCAADGFRFEKLDEYGIKYYVFPDVSNKFVSSFIHISLYLKKIIKNEDITVVHTHHRMCAFYSKVASLSSHYTRINTAHNTFYDKKYFTKFIYKNVYNIACGDEVKKNLVDYYGIEKDYVTVIHNAIEKYDKEIVQVDILRKYHALGYKLVANIGRFTEQKGMKYFLMTLPNVKKRYTNVKYIIVGDGPEKDELIRLCKKLNIEEDVIFLGYRTDVQNIIKQVDFVVLSSLWEGLPLTPIEAFSVSKPVIATAVDGTIEIIQNNYNGFLVEPKNVNKLEEKIVYMLIHSDKTSDMGKNAYARYLEEFSFSIYRSRILDFYSAI